MRNLRHILLASALLAGSALASSYTVKPGDTLSGIAKRHSVSVEDIVRNDPAITDANKHLIRSGQKIEIPDPDTTTVKPGDTLSAIAGRYKGVSWKDLQAANHLDSTIIRPGQRLTIPKPKKASPAASKAEKKEPVWKFIPDASNFSTRVYDKQLSEGLPIIWYSKIGNKSEIHSKFNNYLDQKGSSGFGRNDEFHYGGTGAVEVGRYNGSNTISAAWASKVLPQTKRFAFALADYMREQKIGDPWFEFNAGRGHTKSFNHTDHVKGLGIDVFLLDKDRHRVGFDPRNERSRNIYDQIIEFTNKNADEYNIRMTIGYDGCTLSDKANKAHNNHPHISLKGVR